jgi:hypothetical protein
MLEGELLFFAGGWIVFPWGWVKAFIISLSLSLSLPPTPLLQSNLLFFFS